MKMGNYIQTPFLPQAANQHDYCFPRGIGEEPKEAELVLSAQILSCKIILYFSDGFYTVFSLLSCCKLPLVWMWNGGYKSK